MADYIVIDGSMGEGGGQILRTAVSLSAVFGIPIKVINIRAKRKNPGLRPQHLTAIKALAMITGARVTGLNIGSREITFEPGYVRGGKYNIDIGTAGSISLLLQALLPALAYADRPVWLRIRGGTDVKMAPSIDYMRFVLRPLLEKFNYKIDIKLIRRGHYPKGGGIVEVSIQYPPKKLNPVSLLDRGKLIGINGLSHCVRLPPHVAKRQANSARKYIVENLGIEPQIITEYYKPGEDPHLGPGSGITLWASFEKSVMGADSVGERGKRAEIVGLEAARKLVEDIKTNTSIDRHSSDMLPVYMALADGISEYTGAMLTMHTKTVFELLKIIIPNINIYIEGKINKPFKARIEGIGKKNI